MTEPFQDMIDQQLHLEIESLRERASFYDLEGSFARSASEADAARKTACRIRLLIERLQAAA